MIDEERYVVYNPLLQARQLKDVSLEVLFATQEVIKIELERREHEAQTRARAASDEYTALLMRLGKSPM